MPRLGCFPTGGILRPWGRLGGSNRGLWPPKRSPLSKTFSLAVHQLSWGEVALPAAGCTLRRMPSPCQAEPQAVQGGWTAHGRPAIAEGDCEAALESLRAAWPYFSWKLHPL
jgi:hypothetical protein